MKTISVVFRALLNLACVAAALAAVPTPALAAGVCTLKPLDLRSVVSDGGFAYRLQKSFGAPPDTSLNPTRSPLRLFENSSELGPAHSVHDDIRNLGRGRFSHWGDTSGTSEALRFAASDNSDPRTNGRTYTYCLAAAAAADTIAPTVSISSPSGGVSVSGNSVSIVASAADNVGVVGVQFQLDGANLGTELTAAPYVMTWNSLSASNGSHRLNAVARDAAGNATTSSAVSVVVSNSATCSMLSLNVAASVTDGGFAYRIATAFGIPADSAAAPTASTLRLFENGVELAPAHALHDAIRTSGAGRFSHWSAADGSDEALRFSAADNSNPASNGRRYSYCTGSAAVVDRTPPSVSFASPAAGSTLAGNSVVVSANASDNVTVLGVQFKLDGGNLGAEANAAPYRVTWDTTQASNGSHVLSAVARDAAGNVTSSVLSVNVNNVAAAISSSSATKTLLYGWINDYWLSDTLARWAQKGYAGFLLPGSVQWFTPAAELETHRSHFTNLNQRGAAYGITDNFFVIPLSVQRFDDGSFLPTWDDDAGWASVLATFSNIASFAHSTGMKGIAIDTENYVSYLLWNVADPRHGGRSQASLKPLVYRRGQQLMQTLQTAFPGIQVLLLQEGGLWASQNDANYTLWPDFYNGMASLQPQPGLIVGAESTYPEDVWIGYLNSTPDTLVRNQAVTLNNAMVAIADNPTYWQQAGSLALGMRPLGVSTSDKSARYSPAVFKAQLAAAKAVSGPYVWVYSTGSAWWQMTPQEVDVYSNNPWHYTSDPANEVRPPDSSLQSYFDVLMGRY